MAEKVNKPLYLVAGLFLFPATCAMVLSLFDSIIVAAGVMGGFTAESVSLLGGIVAFSFCWASLPLSARTYVFAHEMTHAIWALLFGAKISSFSVKKDSGHVMISKSNMLITLAPYFFPFYTFVVIVVALITYAFLNPLPYLPFWLFLIGFTWAFHVLYTISTLSSRQPDIMLYGRLFSWVFIFIVNMAIILIWIAAMTQLTFKDLFFIFIDRQSDVYGFVWDGILSLYKLCVGKKGA
jgi:hypothetical protein